MGLFEDALDSVCEKELPSFELLKFRGFRFSSDFEQVENCLTQPPRKMFVVEIRGLFHPGRRLGEKEDLDTFWLPFPIDPIALEWKVGEVDCISIFRVGLCELHVTV